MLCLRFGHAWSTKGKPVDNKEVSLADGNYHKRNWENHETGPLKMPCPQLVTKKRDEYIHSLIYQPVTS